MYFTLWLCTVGIFVPEPRWSRIWCLIRPHWNKIAFIKPEQKNKMYVTWLTCHKEWEKASSVFSQVVAGCFGYVLKTLLAGITTRVEARETQKKCFFKRSAPSSVRWCLMVSAFHAAWLVKAQSTSWHAFVLITALVAGPALVTVWGFSKLSFSTCVTTANTTAAV